MNKIVLLVFLAALGACGWFAAQKIGDMSARSDFSNRCRVFASAVQNLSGRPSVGEIEALFESWVEAAPKVSLVEGGLRTRVVAFPNPGNNEPPELANLPVLQRGNARNLAIRNRNVELIELSADLVTEGGEPFNVTQWAMVADRR